MVTRYDIKKCSERLLSDTIKAHRKLNEDGSTYNSRQFHSLKNELISYISAWIHLLEASKHILPYSLWELWYDIDVIE